MDNVSYGICISYSTADETPAETDADADADADVDADADADQSSALPLGFGGGQEDLCGSNEDMRGS